MTLVVEDGTGKSDANTFVSVGEADAYLAARGITTWSALLTPEKEAALIRAVDYFTEFTFQGVRAVSTQALAWPRSYVYVDSALWDKTVVHPNVKQAQIELAWRAAGGPLNPDIKGDDTQREVTKVVKRVGPIDKETTYASRGQMAVPRKPVWSAVLSILSPLLRQGGGVYR